MIEEGPTCYCCGLPLRWCHPERRWVTDYSDDEFCSLVGGHHPSHDAILAAITLLFAAYVIAENLDEQEEYRRIGEALIEVSPGVTPCDLELCRIEALAQVAMSGEYDVHFDA